MILKELHIVNYKNIDEKKIEFDATINAFVGKNGVGKTNILDSIYHLSLGKSYFNPLANQNIRHGADFYLIEGHFEQENKKEHIVSSLKRNQKKVLKRNGKIYEKLSDHIGLIPVVIISPSDSDLINEGSEFRRKFFDSIISFLDHSYLSILINYQKIVQQRNALLKYFALNQLFDEVGLLVYNEQLIELGNIIHARRLSFIEDFQIIFQKYYAIISSNVDEVVTILYQSQLLENNFEDLLKINLNKDKFLQYTSVGIHKDDFMFNLENYPIKKFGSQGQQKSFLVALKLAHYEIVKKTLNNSPILLFDDVFDKLDEMRVEKIIKLINDGVFGQIFLTDTHLERTNQILKKMLKSYNLCIL